eukprot:NODE_6_length_70510_cov_1.054395.p32 type:complete len:286 gc:universal NODE_6_length_70510_cov_1.054395:41337-42194(+)
MDHDLMALNISTDEKVSEQEIQKTSTPESKEIEEVEEESGKIEQSYENTDQIENLSHRASPLLAPKSPLLEENRADIKNDLDAVQSDESVKSLSVKSGSPIKDSNQASPAKLSLYNSPVIESDSLPEKSRSVYVSKIDAGIAILMSDDYHLIEWPVSLLPPDIRQGMYFDLNISENVEKKMKEEKSFYDFQTTLLEKYSTPKPLPKIKAMARGHGIQIEVENLIDLSPKYIEIYIDDQEYKKSFEKLSENAVLISLEKGKTYNVFIKAHTSSGTFESNREDIEIV